ncbi:hypothetical protein ACSNOI_16325 [Actinomadura kijaniata]|uniref:hypothetical protein n=1 Tax=Actinomadura kijaniata TaxID=46161 RepID=UPI003F19DC12
MSVTEHGRRTPRVRVPRKAPRPPLWRRWLLLLWPLALAAALALTGLAVGAWAERREAGSPAVNRALVDRSGDAELIREVSASIAQIFTYTHADPAATERAASRVLTGTAATQYRTLFGQVRQSAPAQRLSLTTKVTRAGVVRRTADGTAVLIVFLDQTATRAGRPTGPPVAAQLVVTARDDGGWRISDLRAA